MHEIQQRLLALIRQEDISDLSYRQVAERIGCEHASQVKHHIEQLLKKRLLERTSTGRLVVTGQLVPHESNILSIPVMGEADCGEATKLATDEVSGYLSVSPSVLHTKSLKDIYALKARGNSMNRASVHNNSIDDGDYVIVKKVSPEDVRTGDYVVSLIQGFANIKTLKIDRANNRLLLQAESFDDYPPIVIAEEDRGYYQLMGKVIEVVKT